MRCCVRGSALLNKRRMSASALIGDPYSTKAVADANDVLLKRLLGLDHGRRAPPVMPVRSG
jgi:hypothetical protein